LFRLLLTKLLFLAHQHKAAGVKIRRSKNTTTTGITRHRM